MKTPVWAALALLAGTAHAEPDEGLIRAIDQPKAIHAIENAACSQTYSTAGLAGRRIVFWRKCGEFQAYMNVSGKLKRLEYVDPGDYPPDHRLPYRESWIGDGLIVTVHVMREAFCADNDEACVGVRHEGVLIVEGTHERESMHVAGYSGY